MKFLAVSVWCLGLFSCSFTPADHQRIANSLQVAGNNISAQQAEARYYQNQSNQSAINYLQQRSLIQQQSRQNDLNNFRQESYRRNLDRRLDNIERNTDSYRAF